MAQIACTVEEASQVGEVRRSAVTLADAMRWNETERGKLAVVVTEVATNILKHAAKGSILLGGLPGPDDAEGVEIIALDQGPGMKNTGESVRDGHSTTGTSGIGLGAVSRMAEELEFFSAPGKGTALRCVVRRRDGAAQHGHAIPAAGNAACRCGAVSIAKPGETANGDAWLFVPSANGCLLLLIDGLGHGPEAAEAAQTALQVAERKSGSAVVEIMQDVHDALRATRGAAGAAAKIDLKRQNLSYCGIGNIAGEIRRAGAVHRLLSHNGILGHQTRRMQAFDYVFPQGAMLTMHTDGLGTRWDLKDYPGLDRQHPALVAATLYRDHSRRRDDVTVAVLQQGTPGSAGGAAP